LNGNKGVIFSWVCAAAVLLLTYVASAGAESASRTSLHIVVVDADTGQPINQARLTLQFREPGSPVKLKRSKPISYNAKTNAQGKCRFTNIPKGTIHLIVTAERHQSSGKDYELEQDNQAIEVKLRKPQPLL